MTGRIRLLRRAASVVVGGTLALVAVWCVAVFIEPTDGRRPRPVPAAGFPMPITSATLLCPDLRPPAGSAVTVDVATAGGGVSATVPAPGSGRGPVLDGQVQLSAGDKVKNLHSGPVRRRASVQVSGGEPLAVRASGPAAAGLSATVTAPGAGGRASVIARCERPRSEFWLVGPATVAGRDPLVVLTNPEATPARAQITVFADGGADSGADSGAGATTGVVVPPRASVTRRLATWVPDADATVVRVQVRDGRLAALVLDRAGGPFARDSTVVPVVAGAGPAGSLLLAGAATGVGDARVVVAAPEAAAVIRLDLLTPSASYIPVGFADLRVPRGGVIRLPALPGGAGVAALRLTVRSGGPVIAALGLPMPAAGPGQAGFGQPGLAPAPGYRWVGPADVIHPVSTAATLLPPATGQGVRTLVLTAPDTAVTVWFDGTPVAVPAGRTVAVGPGNATRMVTQGGPLVAALTVGSGAGSSVLTLSSAPRTVSAPALVHDPRAAFRR
ncbi:DUF5719 family protein [Frankia sp. Cr1]|uniref:DUF5719 family protein n=1 Tax=Frankia sp. Cr1 TaxID=3073931 RepID=UPI002AD525FE|nr:DUF5719 family protein [Frankia sp. Cr1]